MVEYELEKAKELLEKNRGNVQKVRFLRGLSFFDVFHFRYEKREYLAGG